MKESDFPQFDNPRVREMMAAAANLVEMVLNDDSKLDEWYYHLTNLAQVLETALFAAQHSKPKNKWTPAVEQQRLANMLEIPVDILNPEHASKSKCDCYDDGIGAVLGPKCQSHRPVGNSFGDLSRDFSGKPPTGK